MITTENLSTAITEDAVEPHFRLKFLPATYGDCIIVEYGEGWAVKRILIDGGTSGTRHAIISYMGDLPEAERRFELVIVTHYDRDHIDGILSILEMETLPFGIKEIWFNGWKHLLEGEEVEQFGGIMAEDLTIAIRKQRLNWNIRFNQLAIVVPRSGELPVINLEGGLKLTLLSPYRENLNKLKEDWHPQVVKKGKIPGYGDTTPITKEKQDSLIEVFGANEPDVEQLNKKEFEPDDAAGNGSSIALLAEFKDKSVLLLGDAHPPVILKSLDTLKPDGKFEVSALKLSHHGSRHNTGPKLIQKLDCKIYVVSTNGAISGHPHPETIAWIIKRGGKTPVIYFNYESESNKIWGKRGLQSRFIYKTCYPPDGNELTLLPEMA